MKKRELEEYFFKTLMRLSAIIIIGVLLLIIYTIFIKGLPALNWQMITETPKGGYYLGKEGGILNAIVGSLILASAATLLATVISVPIVIYINVFCKKTVFSNTIRLCFDIMWGIPSIVYGAFGFTIMVFLGMRTSLLAGIIIVALVILPVIVRLLDEVVRLISSGLYEASYALGATRLQTARKVIIKQASTGLLTAILVAFGRGIGDAAAVLFTTGYTDSIPSSLFQAAATLPLAIFFQLTVPIPEVTARAYASALILTIIILIVSLIARILTNRHKKFKA